MSQTSQVSASIAFTRKASADGSDGAKVEQTLQLLESLTSGTGSGQCDLGFVDSARALASAASEDFDFAGALTSALGETITAVEIVALMIKAAAANTTDLTIGGATAEWRGPFAAAGDKLTLRPGEAFLIYSNTGWAVAAGTADDLKITNGSGAGATFDIAFLARSA